MKKCINLTLAVLTTLSTSLAAQAQDAIVTDAYGRKILTAPTSYTLEYYMKEAQKHAQSKNPSMVMANIERATNLAIEKRIPYSQLESTIVAYLGDPKSSRSYSLAPLRHVFDSYKIRGFSVASAFAALLISTASSADESSDSVKSAAHQAKDLGLIDETE